MTTEEIVIQRLSALINESQAIETTQWIPQNTFPAYTYVDYGGFSGWKAQSRSALISVLSENHPYISAFDQAVQSNYLSHLQAGRSILQKVSEDLQRGYFTTLRTLVSAEIFTDFLEMVDHLIETNFKDPAAMLLGAVLEDGLRRIVVTHGQPVSRDDGISSLSQKCVQANVYGPLRHREVMVWNQVRNSAAHAHFEEYSPEDVLKMSQGVSAFLADYLK